MIKVLLAEESRLLREGIKLVLCSDEQITVTGIAGTSDEILQNIKENSYDVLLADLNISGGIWKTLPQIKELDKGIRIVVFSQSMAPIFNTLIYKNGADAFISTDFSGHQIIGAIKGIHSGEYIPEKNEFSKLLTLKQAYILWYTISGYTLSQIAEKTSMNIKTVNTHKIRAYAKLGIKNNLEAVQLFGKKSPVVDFKEIVEL